MVVTAVNNNGIEYW